MKYQIFKNLKDEQYAALEADIKKRGVMVPVEVDENSLNFSLMKTLLLLILWQDRELY